MNQSERIAYTAADAIGAGLAGAWTRVRDAFRAYVEVRSRESAIRELERLSDHTLRDIGLHRGEIRDAVYREATPWS
jgi:uncharacterized protein YjiS (DUF1127 family)